MATAITRLELDRNAAAFQIPAGLDASAARLAGNVSNTFKRIDSALRKISIAVDGPDGSPNAPADLVVVTGGSIVGNNIVLTTVVARISSLGATGTIIIPGTACP